MHSALLLLAVLSVPAWGKAQAWPKLPACSEPTRHKPNAGFVTTRKGHLYLNGRPFDFRSFNMPGFSGDEPFEITDGLRSLAAFAAPVVRTYTLGLTSINVGEDDAHIKGYNHTTGKFIFNEKKFRALDYAFAQAANFGVKVIMPVLNVNYGDNTTDWVGNFVDLTRMVYAIDDYNTARDSIDFFKDKKMRKAYKQIIQYLLTRRNTVNGRIYGHDDTILAWQTGNEMNYGGHTGVNAAPPGEWTVDICKTFKSFAPKTLTFDGSFSRTASAATAWTTEALKSQYVDLFGYHFYGSGDMAMAPQMVKRVVRDFGKTFIVDEYGFFTTPKDYKRMNSKEFKDVAGMLVWSLRPHSADGGFLTHSEGDGQFSWHIPGWKTPAAADFMPNEHYVVRNIYNASYTIINKKPAPYPVPIAPEVTPIVNKTHTGFTFRGSAWGEHYELWSANFKDFSFSRVGRNIRDNVDAGTLFVAVNPANSTQSINPTYAPVVVHKSLPTWHDSKWNFKRGHFDLAARALARPHAGAILQRNVAPAATAQMPAIGTILKRAPAGSRPGTWYALRAVNPHGVTGPFSEPFFLNA